MSGISPEKTTGDEIARAKGSILPALAAAALALLATGAFEYTVISIGEDARHYLDRAGLAWFSYSRAALLMIATALLFPRLDRRSLAALWPIWMVCAYFALTVLWSRNPSESVTSLFRLACAMVPGLWIATAPSPERAMARLGQAGVLVLASTAAAVLIFPDLAFMRGQHEAALRGALAHKNGLGFHLTLAALIFLCRFFDTRRPVWLAAHALAWVGIAFTQSDAALVLSLVGAGLAIGLAAATALVSRPMLPALAMILTLLCLPVIPLLAEFAGPATGQVGYDAGFNGREAIWAFAVRMAEAGGAGGYGYDAFWPGVLSTGHAGFGQNWLAAHAHNGFLDAWLAGGVLGGALVASLFVVLWWRAISMLPAAALLGARVFPLAATIVLISYNSVETLFPAGTTFAAGLVVALAAMPPGPRDAR